jgi:hypothetical protein
VGSCPKAQRRHGKWLVQPGLQFLALSATLSWRWNLSVSPLRWEVISCHVNVVDPICLQRAAQTVPANCGPLSEVIAAVVTLNQETAVSTKADTHPSAVVLFIGTTSAQQVERSIIIIICAMFSHW